MKSIFVLMAIAQLSAFTAFSQRVKIANGELEGITETSGIRSFKGIPFAQPPVGDLRWTAPQAPKNWEGLLKADHFGSNAMQKPVFGDMGFRSPSMSEDCLYLNVWTPAKSANEKLPVLVYFYGGGYVAGDGSERRYDGEQMARKGIVTLTVNYRLGIFGFMAHPELSKESAQHASGNYGLLDQQAALLWVQKNIAAFGGDPKRVTIAGESAGSISVSAQMVSPLSKDLIAGAIGESGAMINPTLAAIPLSEGEQNGQNFGTRIKAGSLAALRAIPAAALLDSASKPGAFRTAATIDNYFLVKSPAATFAAGEQAKVPLLAGWNSAEIPYQAIMQADAPTVENYKKKVKAIYGDKTEEALKLYPATNEAEVVQVATDLASDRFIVYSTWKWLDLHQQTSGKAVYGYIFSKSKPALTEEMKDAVPGLAGGVTKKSAGTKAPAAAAPVSTGAPHAFEIEYAMGNLASNKMYAWTAADYKVSELMLNYFANFIKNGNPNGPALPKWDAFKGKDIKMMNLDVKSGQENEKHRARYLFLDQFYTK